MAQRTTRRLALGLILLGYVLLAVGYGVLNPLFEAPDEHLHFFTAVWIAENNALPSVPQPAREGFFIPQSEADWLGQEAAQPPLYYLLASLFLRPFDTSHGRAQTIHNPFVRLGEANPYANRNAFIHAYDQLRPDAAGHVWGAHLLRLLSTLIGLGTLGLIYASARLYWPDVPERALLATGLVAFLPQFTFQHSAISNDVLVTFLATAVLYQLLRHEKRTPLTFATTLLLGFTIGLTGLTKNQGTALLVYTLGFLFMRGWGKGQAWGTTLRQLLLVALPALVLLLPLWWRNWQLYGDPTAVNQFVILAGGNRSYTLWQVLGESSGIWFSLFANFGWFNLLAPAWVYWLWTALALLALSGIALDWRGWRDGFKPLITSLPFLLLGWVLLVYASLLLFMMQTPAAQGRLLFPALLPLALGMAYGLTIWTSKWPRHPAWLWLVLLAGLWGVNLYLLTAVVRPAYAAPPLYASPPSLPALHPLDLTFPSVGRLLGYQLDTRSLTPGAPFRVQLLWEMGAPTPRPITQFVQVVGEDGRRWLGQDSFHGGGNWTTAQWRAGQFFVEDVWLDGWESGADGDNGDGCESTAVRLNLGLYDSDQQPIPSQLQTNTTTLGILRLPPATNPTPDCPIHGRYSTPVNFNDQIHLLGAELPATYHLTTTLPLTLTWQSVAPTSDDLVVFLHLVSATDGTQIATYDAPPTSSRDGATYPTSLWQPGDIVWDVRQLALPADLPHGRYHLTLGLYRPTDFARLPILTGSTTDNAWLILTFDWPPPTP
jgi:hypothetical protein